MHINDVIQMAQQYELDHSNPAANLPKYEFSDLYELWPDRDLQHNHEKNLKWVNGKPFPFNNHSGVYLICDASLDVIYIGRAVKVGWRLHTYFKENETGWRLHTYFKENETGCYVVHSVQDEWANREPCFIKCVATPENYMSYSLEQYLIINASPAANKVGKSRNPES